jgi:hypothetical protein
MGKNMLDVFGCIATGLICVLLGGEAVGIFAPEDRAIGGLCGLVTGAIICILVMN